MTDRLIKRFLKQLCKEPLLHFLLLGALLFCFFDYFSPKHGDPDTQHIVVSETELLKYMQYRQRVFGRGSPGSTLAELDAARRRELIDGYVREQALLREARALGLDQEDYIITQRLVQKMEFVLKGFSEVELELSANDVQQFYSKHAERYAEPSTISFSHIFFDTHDRPVIQIRKRLDSMLGELRNSGLAPARLDDRGDRFMYYRHYMDKPRAFIESHFGEEFSAALFDLQVLTSWQGPLRSGHGEHIVWISQKRAGGVPSLEDIYARVENDLRSERVKAAMEEKIHNIVQRYTVEQVYPLTGKGQIK